MKMFNIYELLPCLSRSSTNSSPIPTEEKTGKDFLAHTQDLSLSQGTQLEQVAESGLLHKNIS